MRICHLCLNGPYNEGWNYQENVLPKYHVKQGYEVYQIVTPYMWEGTEQVISTDKRYKSPMGVEVIRCNAKKGLIGGTRLNRYPEVKGLLEEIKPEILFIHDVQCLDMMVVAKYLQNHPECTVYADNHSDFSNSATNWISKNLLHKILWRRMAQIIQPYVKTFYGVLPARVNFLVNMYKLPEKKCKLLVMGADDELVQAAAQPEVKKSIREKHNIADDDFLIITGGKIDLSKTQTILLMQAVKRIRNEKVKLIVFGSVVSELQEKIKELSDGIKIQYIGWVQADDSYPLFAAADLVVFPGRHSVFWEQVVGQGIPMIVKYWDGTTHVDCSGNVSFLYEDSEAEIQVAIERLLDSEVYATVKNAAIEASDRFKYSSIARRSIDVKE